MNEEKVVVQKTWYEILRVANDIFNYPLIKVNNTAVSLSTIVLGIAMLVIGYLLSRRGAKEVDKRLLIHVTPDEGLRYTLSRFVFYIFMSLATIFTLNALAVPVGIFAFIGGGLAVGIGFGSQNLVNNFISGILVMIERPIRVGDFVELDGVSGTIESIGIRASDLRTGQNALTVIPNTRFIEKNLTNWTMSEKVSSTVRFRVAYGTDTHKLSELCLRVISGVEGVEQMPPPTLALVDFGEYGLIFDLGYSLKTAIYSQKGSIESTIRFRLNDAFVSSQIKVPAPHINLGMNDGNVRLLT